VPSHDGTARALEPLPGTLLVVTDARRREVYLSAYRADGGKALGPLVVAPAAVPQLLAEQNVAPGFITGSGGALLAPFRSPAFDPTVLDTAGASTSLGLVERAAVALLTGVVPGPLTPLYLRRPDATEPGARRKSVLGR
jgi:tRNA A37 threonylcarbamoyladenosine modification protein TsaB